MNPTVKKIILNWRMIIVFTALIMSLIVISPEFNTKGVAIRNVVLNSSANEAGIISPPANTAPTQRERILSVNNIPVNSITDYYSAVETLKANETYIIRTNKNNKQYLVRPRPLTETIYLNQTEEKNITEIVQVNVTDDNASQIDANASLNQSQNESSYHTINQTVNRTILVNKSITKVIGVEDLGIFVQEVPSSNIRQGLDLQGGTRVLLQPETPVSEDVLDIAIDNIKERINVFGLSDVVVTRAGDLSGNQFIRVEIAGVNEQDVKELLSKQGKFESKIGDRVAFKGGDKDITYVCRSADCSGLDPRRGCQQVDGGVSCGFYFSITLSPDAAQRQADLTRNLDVVAENGNEYLSKDIVLFLDDKEVDRLRIGADLKGNPSTNIQISGSGFGTTYEEARDVTFTNMKRLQTILITGSLPVKLNIVKTDTISPSLGSEFLKSAIAIGIASMISIVVIVFIRYRRLAISLPMIFTIFSELILLLGFAALAKWNLDLASIAGIIIAIGTGVDHQIVIADEALAGGETNHSYDWKKKLQKAFFIIFAAYTTTVVAMVPLGFAGAGLLKGFALTTIVGVTIGVFITRPAYAALVEILVNK